MGIIEIHKAYIQCSKCKKNNILMNKTKTTVSFGNYKSFDISKLIEKNVYLCEDCSNKLKKWIKKE